MIFSHSQLEKVVILSMVRVLERIGRDRGPANIAGAGTVASKETPNAAIPC